MKLSGHYILVTGATGAIGQAICRALVADGANVVVHYGRNRAAAEALVETLDGRGWCVPAGLSEPAGPQALWDEAIAAAGRLTGLVNNAGIRSEVAIDAPMEEWQRVWAHAMRVNFLSAVDFVEACHSALSREWWRADRQYGEPCRPAWLYVQRHGLRCLESGIDQPDQIHRAKPWA
ncbi:SDR family NAD(P)-dependent oxidoreductase [Pararhizobium sp. BT-229]|nr:SDR family NAD(P)-dependent oxidoreductase [Pararhizobium sp. BT-229]